MYHFVYFADFFSCALAILDTIAYISQKTFLIVTEWLLTAKDNFAFVSSMQQYYQVK